VDLKRPEGREIVRRLAERADVFAENFRPGVMERLGLAYADLRPANPGLVYLSINGFGSAGPYAHKSAYDPVVQAYGGLAAVQAGADGPPQLIRHTAADKITALTASQAVTAALLARERGAGGQHLEVTMLESVVQFVWADAAGNEIFLAADGSQPSSFSRDQKLWKTKDGWIIAAPTGDKDVEAICRGVGVDGWDDPEVRTIAARRRNPAAFVALLRRVLERVETMTTEEALAGWSARRRPAAP
jgi:crotonobetainyl-CoA:carnitine CoA-transferase CaiB-like acyl-CoA transferase